MGWSIGFDSERQRDIGYGVPASCEHPDCKKAIDRGLAHTCKGECGLYFCGAHLNVDGKCARCVSNGRPFRQKPDTKKWLRHKLTHKSWALWRAENPRLVRAMHRRLESPS